MNTTFQKFLKHAFSTSGLTRENFAKKIGVSKNTLGNYLSGRTSPSFDEGCRIIKLTEIYSVSIHFKIPDEEYFDNKDV